MCVCVRICLLDTSASSALGVFDDNVLYKSTYFLVFTCLLGVVNTLVLSRGTDLRLISLDVPYFTDVVLPINNSRLQNAVAADLDPLTGH